MHRNLKALRRTHNMKQEVIAAHLGISQAAYSDRERGVTALTDADKLRLCALYKVELEELLGLPPRMANTTLEPEIISVKWVDGVMELRLRVGRG